MTVAGVVVDDTLDDVVDTGGLTTADVNAASDPIGPVLTRNCGRGGRLRMLGRPGSGDLTATRLRIGGELMRLRGRRLVREGNDNLVTAGSFSLKARNGTLMGTKFGALGAGVIGIMTVLVTPLTFTYNKVIYKSI